MKHLVLLVSLVAINCAIRVPNNWRDIYPTAVTVRAYKEFKPRRSSVGRQYYYKNPQRYADISNAGWKPPVANLSPVKSKQLKSMFYKKGLEGKYALNRINAVPYITYKKTANSPLFITPESISSKAYPKIQKKPSKIQKPNYTTFDHANNVPFNSHIKPSKQLPFDNFNHHQSYEPNKNIINYFQAVKSDNFVPDNKLITYTNEESNDNANSFTTYNTPRNNQIDSYSPSFFSHLQKNYRDDVNFEPEKEDKHYVKEEDPKFERNEVPQHPVSSHEIPKEIPTKPIYPGKGLWARPGLKHKPFVSQQAYEELKDDGPTPEGYDTFIEGRQVFEKNSEKFRSFPAQPEIGRFINQHSIKDINDDTPKENLQNQEKESEEEAEEFVPTKLYAQVRASEDTEYLPMEETDDGVLREAINESKIHTIYTEEGYEDSAYDHAGHEKEAENDEGFEDLQREKHQKTEKRVPEAKYRLLPPSLHRTKFSYGGNLLTDEEIAEIKQTQLGLGDSDAQGTHFQDLQLGEDVEENEEIDEISEESTEQPKLPKRNNNFISTKETKTMTTKENNDGDTETEISSKVKIILQPNNSTESKKYVKVFPKVYKTIKRKKQKLDNEASKDETDRNKNGIYIEEITTTTEYSTTEYQDLPEEIPITTVPTTAIPKPVHVPDEETLDDINKAFLKINRRYKRNIDDKKTKYPYYDNYKSMGLNVDSPLRYSQDMNQIPRKVGKKMVFYEEAEKRVPCPDIDTSLNPIPDRIQNVEKKVNEKNQININHNNDNEDDNDVNKDEEEEEEEVEEESGSEESNEKRKKREANEESHSPRIAGLGNKIDCLKVRYFGENPLDSPIFDEITVGTVEPIFKPLKTVKLNDELRKQSHNQPKKDTQRVLINSTKDNAVTTISTINLITTPDYKIALKPKHIYDQIQLLEHLPNYRESINTNKSSSNLKELNVGSRQDKSVEDDNIAYESTDNHPTLPEAEELRRRRKIRRKRPLYQIFDVNKYLPTTPPPILQPITPYPQLTPIVNTKISVPKATNLQIFDVNKFIPTTPSYIREIITSSTVLPKYKVLSEVFYKDDIKPNEQLQVFNDILNNIKNSSQIQNDTVDEPSEPVSVKLNSQNRFRYEDLKKQSPVHYHDSYLKAYGDQEIDQNYLSPATTTTTTTTLRPTTYRRTRYKVKKTPERSESPDRDFQQQLKLYVALQEAKKKEKEQQTVNDFGYTIPVKEDENDYVEKTTKVVGLLPPGSVRYKTIYHPKRDSSQHISSPNQKKRKMNKFFVVGLKPPPHQKQLTYLDFLNNNHVVRKSTLRRGRRSANRGSYASFSRNRGDSEEATAVEDDDDYKPHRSKNYYYDEKTGKIIYATTKKPDNEEYVDYEEITEELPAPPSTSKPLQDPVFATATPPPEGKGYVDFVLKLKQHKNYKYIPDPTTTEKGLEPSTERTTTQKPQSTTPPEFLNILAKVRQNPEYKHIEDKKGKTTPTPEDIYIEEDEDIPLENVQNSPGKHNLDSSEYFGIFDVTDFIPKIKNYLPKTSYDTSKYKTIERPTVQKSDEDEEDDEEQVTTSSTTQAPIQTTTTQKSFVIITEEVPNRDSITKQSEERPVTVRRRRPTTTRTTSTTQKPTTKAPIIRRRPTILRSTKTTTSHPTTEAVRRTFRRRPTTQKTPIGDLSNYEENNPTKVIRRRSDHTTTTEPTITTRKTNKFIETFKKFHRNKKHQNAPEQSKKSEETANKDEETANKDEETVNKDEETVNKDEETVNKDVEIIADYDKTKRHGGNYRSIEDIEELMEEETDENDSKGNSNSNSLRISLLPSKEDAEENNEDSLEGRSLPRRKIVRKKFKGKVVTEPSVARLTDVVPKPEMFYTDPTLPRSINMLINEDNLSSTEIQDIVSSTDSSETAENKQLNNKSNKSPVIIKDPSKRLYFYAPV